MYNSFSLSSIEIQPIKLKLFFFPFSVLFFCCPPWYANFVTHSNLRWWQRVLEETVACHPVLWWGCGEARALYCWQECELVWPWWRTIWQHWSRLWMHIALDPATLLLWIYSTDKVVHMLKAVDSNLFIVTLLHNSKWFESTQNLAVGSG